MSRHHNVGASADTEIETTPDINNISQGVVVKTEYEYMTEPNANAEINEHHDKTSSSINDYDYERIGSVDDSCSDISPAPICVPVHAPMDSSMLGLSVADTPPCARELSSEAQDRFMDKVAASLGRCYKW